METNNFAFKVKAILGLESTCLDDYDAKIGLNDPHVYHSKDLKISFLRSNHEVYQF